MRHSGSSYGHRMSLLRHRVCLFVRNRTALAGLLFCLGVMLLFTSVRMAFPKTLRDATDGGQAHGLIRATSGQIAAPVARLEPGRKFAFIWDETYGRISMEGGRAFILANLLKKGGTRVTKADHPDLKFIFISAHDGLSSKYWANGRFKPGVHMINHGPGEFHKFIKHRFLQQNSEYAKRLGCTQRTVIPETFFLNTVEDCVAFFNEARVESTRSNSIWFVKKSNGRSNGVGVGANTFEDTKLLFSMSDDLDANVEECKNIAHQIDVSRMDQQLIQRGVEPLLIRGGRKFDIRCYIVIANHKPLSIYYHPGYLRISLSKFDPNTLDASIHVVNSEANDKNNDLSPEDHYAEQLQLEELLVEMGHDRKEAQSVEINIRKVCAKAVEAMAETLMRTDGYFVLLGADVSVSSDLKPYVLEMNINPHLSDNKARFPISDRMIGGMIDLLQETKSKADLTNNNLVDPSILHSQTPWTLIYSDAVKPPYSYVQNGHCMTDE